MEHFQIAKIDSNNLYPILHYDSIESLKTKFIKNFNEIFKYAGNDIGIIGTVNNAYFDGFKILRILGYENNLKNLRAKLQTIDKSYKKRYGDLVEEFNLPPCTHNESLKVYLTEKGFYNVVMECPLDSAIPFKRYVTDELLLSFRKMSSGAYENLIKQKDDKLDEIIHQNNSILLTNKNLEIQNKNLMNKLKELGISFKESKQEFEERLEDISEELSDIKNELITTNDNLDKVIVDRNIDPNDNDLKHNYILLKNKTIENEYMFIRGQEKYIRLKTKNYKTQFEIKIDTTKNPNPIDFINRLKEEIKIINESNFNLSEVRRDINYINSTPTEKKQIIDSYKKSKSKIIYNSNRIILKDFNEKDLIDLIKNLENEKYNF